MTTIAVSQHNHKISNMNEACLSGRLDFEPFCEPAFLSPDHGWVTGLPIVFLDQLQPNLLESSTLPCCWSILSFLYPTWRMSRVSFCYKVCLRAETQQDAVLNLLKGKDVLVSQPAASAKFIIFQSFPIIVGVVYGWNRRQPQLIGKSFGWVPLMKPIVSDPLKRIRVFCLKYFS